MNRRRRKLGVLAESTARTNRARLRLGPALRWLMTEVPLVLAALVLSARYVADVNLFPD